MSINRSVLILEEELLLALDIEYVLSEAGAVEVTHLRSVSELPPGCGLSSFSLALVEARLGAAEVVAFAERLVQAGVPTVVMSADRKSLELFASVETLAKPFDAASLVAACDAARARIS